MANERRKNRKEFFQQTRREQKTDNSEFLKMVSVLLETAMKCNRMDIFRELKRIFNTVEQRNYAAKDFGNIQNRVEKFKQQLVNRQHT